MVVYGATIQRTTQRTTTALVLTFYSEEIKIKKGQAGD
jgi:hypothetical protein